MILPNAYEKNRQKAVLIYNHLLGRSPWTPCWRWEFILFCVPVNHWVLRFVRGSLGPSERLSTGLYLLYCEFLSLSDGKKMFMSPAKRIKDNNSEHLSISFLIMHITCTFFIFSRPRRAYVPCDASAFYRPARQRLKDTVNMNALAGESLILGKSSFKDVSCLLFVLGFFVRIICDWTQAS